MTTRYLGIDLAWSERSGSGVCVLDENGAILHEDQLAPAWLPDWVRQWRGDRSILALDGPLVVPAGSSALRPVERELHRRYGRYHAGPFPGGAASTAMRGRDRSPARALVDAVGRYVLDPTSHASHRAIEVFPAPTWIELFGLSERVIYKRGRLMDRVGGLARLRLLLARLADAEPSMSEPLDGQLDARMAAARTGREWKAVEDIIDARLCAYTAQLWGKAGKPEWIVTGEGDWQSGYVVVPPGASVTWPAEDVGSESSGQHLRLWHPALDFWVDVRVRRFEGRWLAAADLAEDRPDVGSGDTLEAAVRAALRSLGEPYATDMAESAGPPNLPRPTMM